MRLVSVIMIALLTLTGPLAADTPISLTVSPHISRAPAYIKISVIVPRNPDNRQVCLSVEGDTGFSRSSCWDHVGEAARYQTIVEYKDVPAGEYEVSASITGVNRRSTARESFIVVGDE